MSYAAIIAKEFSAREDYVQNIIALLDEGNTIPFIARYRKEQHGAMDDQLIRQIADKLEYLRNLDARREEVRKLIEAGVLGEVYHVYVSFRAWRSIPGLGGAFTTKEIAGGGALIDWGVHYLDIVMYCTGDPKPQTVSGKAFCKLGADMPNYVYEGMWAEDTKDLNGTYDVDDSVTGFIRTEGPTITFNGAWAQNIGVGECFIDFLGDKAGVRLNYGGNFTVYGTKDGKLTKEVPEYESVHMFQNEIDSFIRCIKTGEKLPSHIDQVIITARMMQAIYDSSEQNQEIKLEW